METKMDLKLYNPTIRVKNQSVLSGEWEADVPLDEFERNFSVFPLVMSFLEDNDIQEMRVTSTNIGFNKTFTKYFRK